MATSSLFCENLQPSPLQLLAVVGVFTQEPRVPYRRAIRGSWLPSTPNASAIYFVLRGLDLDIMMIAPVPSAPARNA